MDVKEWVLSQRENMLDTAMELMKIRSVSEPGTREHPYGEGCAMVLDKALEIGKQMGFETENHDYRCGSILMPGRTGQEIGIFVHLDVVHEGAPLTRPRAAGSTPDAGMQRKNAVFRCRN